MTGNYSLFPEFGEYDDLIRKDRPDVFRDVLLTPEGKWGATIGSSYELSRECQRLAEILELPLDLDPQDETVFLAPDYQGTGTAWKRYGIESYTCLGLYIGPKYSCEYRSALLFC